MTYEIEIFEDATPDATPENPRPAVVLNRCGSPRTVQAQDADAARAAAVREAAAIGLPIRSVNFLAGAESARLRVVVQRPRPAASLSGWRYPHRPRAAPP